MPHLLVNHKSITTLQGEDIVFLATDINLPGAVDWVMMQVCATQLIYDFCYILNCLIKKLVLIDKKFLFFQSCFGHHFMLVLEKQEKNGEEKFFAIVQLIGSRKQTLQFAYRCVLAETFML